MKLAGSQRVLAPSFPQNIPTENAIRFESFAQLLQTLGSLVPDLFMQDIIFKLITHLYDSFFLFTCSTGIHSWSMSQRQVDGARPRNRLRKMQLRLQSGKWAAHYLKETWWDISVFAEDVLPRAHRSVFRALQTRSLSRRAYPLLQLWQLVATMQMQRWISPALRRKMLCAQHKRSVLTLP